MTEVVAPAAPVWLWSRRHVALLATLVLALLAVGYGFRYGHCDGRSGFCTVDIVGTRSEVGAAWSHGDVNSTVSSDIDFYVSTYPASDDR